MYYMIIKVLVVSSINYSVSNRSGQEEKGEKKREKKKKTKSGWEPIKRLQRFSILLLWYHTQPHPIIIRVYTCMHIAHIAYFVSYVQVLGCCTSTRYNGFSVSFIPNSASYQAKESAGKNDSLTRSLQRWIPTRQEALFVDPARHTFSFGLATSCSDVFRFFSLCSVRLFLSRSPPSPLPYCISLLLPFSGTAFTYL